MTTTITRAAKRDVVSYVNQVKNGDYSQPSDSTIRTMSRYIDDSMRRCYDDWTSSLSGTTEMKSAYRDLRRQPRTCGGFNLDTAIFEDLTPFEQMHVVGTWVDKKGPTLRKTHTFSFEVPGDKCVPIWVKKPRGGQVSKMTVMLGNTRGELKAPDYKNWATSDPTGTAQEVFVDPLNCLEMHRRPSCLGALVFKSNAFERRMPTEWRYKVFDDPQKRTYASEASVELPRQSSKKTRTHSEQSAGFNLTKMMENSRYRNRNIMQTWNWEEVLPDDDTFPGYRDDVHPRVTPKDVVKTFSAATRGDTSPLDGLCRQLFTTRLTGSSIPEVQQQIAEDLFDYDDPDID